ncbi:MAG: hypothetical protein CFH06_01275 [Alphaproteobacteria bacterium MarineAlpha3_Bin5]|nr:hypothetical protein [Magnetovibrio sp.]PPR77446.1 MAG: hypothetical protein CFH06_01275 [Alphaproteobacteria bacterium MarineAlpha3_Bin5]|tara:strand:- start:209 stop:430 length:222 start_codon:yes stop_codon:yes gene_type:complete
MLESGLNFARMIKISDRSLGLGVGKPLTRRPLNTSAPISGGHNKYEMIQNGRSAEIGISKRVREANLVWWPVA